MPKEIRAKKPLVSSKKEVEKPLSIDIDDLKEEFKPLDEDFTSSLKEKVTGFGYFTNGVDGDEIGLVWTEKPADIFITDEGMVIFVVDPNAEVARTRR